MKSSPWPDSKKRARKNVLHHGFSTRDPKRSQNSHNPRKIREVMIYQTIESN